MKTFARLWRGAGVVLGVTLISLVLLVVVLEAGYAAYHVARRAAWGKRPMFDSADHPFWKERWFAGRLHQMNQLAMSVIYDPYRGWRLRPTSLPDMHIDSAGLRVTIQPDRSTGARRRVLMLGGSTMWGFSSRDPYTIPSLVASRLARLGITDIEVVNLAGIGYNITQGANTLLLELRRGTVPGLAVSLDGINEVGLVFEGGNPGEVYQQSRAERHFDHSSFWGDVAYLRTHLSGTIRAEGMVLRSLGLAGDPPPRSAELLCADIGAYYFRVARAMESLGREFGFPILFLTTPTLARSRKPRSKWEASIESGYATFRELTVRCGAVTDSLMASRRGSTFFPLDSLFDRDTSSVFIDHYGHVTEEANGLIADRIVQLIVPILRR